MAAGGGGARPRFVRPAGSESLYPSDKDSSEVLISSTADTSLVSDGDAKSTFVYNRYHHLPLDTQRQRLPVFQYRNHILHLLERYQTLVLVGETGSGKSTQVPQYACEVGHRVCVTQPRVTATVALAGRVAAERGELCGGRVGYSVSMDAKRSQETDIVFMTEGVLLREMFASPLLTQYTCVVLDEVHERTQLTDVLMGLLKKIAKKRKKLKIIISSATMDAEYLRGFFNLNAGSGGGESTSVIMSVQGRTHPIDVFYVRDPVPNYVKATVDTVIKIHENKPFGDILAFLTSQEEILDAIDTLESYATDNNSRNKHRARFPSGITACDMRILPMYGSLAHHRQLRVFQMADKNVRKVIVATNIAETSVTVPGVSYVIDCGFHKLPYFDPSIGVESIAICKISQANATQRAGRAGRISKGECYRLYTEEEFEKMAPSVPPEMQRSEMSSVILQLKALGIHNVLRFSFPTPPPAKCLLSGLETLYALGAIDKDGQLTSELGQYMAELPLKPTLAKMLCNSGEFGCIEEALSIVAMLHVENIFVKSKSGQENIKAKISKRNNFEVAEGDLMTYLNIFDGYTKVEYEEGNDRQRQKARKAWCRKMYLNDRVMEKVFEVRRTLEKLIKYKFKMKDTTFEGYDLGSAKTERIQKCIMSGLFPQASRLGPTGTYLSLSRDAQLHISPDSCLHNASQPQWVVFTSVQCVRDKTYMRDVTAIKKEWLLQIAPHFYRQN